MTDMTQDNRRALVTGAATGLGREIALALGAAGWRVALADIDSTGLAATLAEPALAGSGSIAVDLDLRAEASIDAAMARVFDAFGGLDLLVNNAGVTIHKPAVELTWADWDAVHDVNLKGAFFLARAYVRRLIATGGTGNIVGLASAHGIVGFPDRSAYGISKAGMIHLTKMLAVEWAPLGIRVNAIAPGTIMTPSRQELLKDPAARARMLGRIPLGRFPTAEEVAACVLYLAGPQTASMTGHTIVLDGGTTVA